MNILVYIPYGKEKAISRQMLCELTKLNDRDMRTEIAKARRINPILNAQDGKGYYQPLPEEIEEAKDFLRQESDRAKSIFYSLYSVRNWIKEKEANKHYA